MQQKRVLIFLFFTVGLIFFMLLIKFDSVFSNNRSEIMSNSVSTGSIYSLNEKEINLLIKEADKGNKDAAYKLYEYYSLSALNDELAYKWLLKAAQAEHPIAQYNLAIFLLQKDQKSDAAFWAKKAYGNGVSLSDELSNLIENE